jgi:hypothetical protein
MAHIRKLSRLAAVIGGVLMMIGMIFTGMFLLAVLNLIDVSFLVHEATLVSLMVVFLVIGILDLVAAVILLRR